MTFTDTLIIKGVEGKSERLLNMLNQYRTEEMGDIYDYLECLEIATEIKQGFIPMRQEGEIEKTVKITYQFNFECSEKEFLEYSKLIDEDLGDIFIGMGYRLYTRVPSLFFDYKEIDFHKKIGDKKYFGVELCTGEHEMPKLALIMEHYFKLKPTEVMERILEKNYQFDEVCDAENLGEMENFLKNLNINYQIII